MNVGYDLLIPTEVGLAGGVAPLEGEYGHRVGAVGGLVCLDVAVQMGDVAHLVMADGGIAPTSICAFGEARTITPEAVWLRIASAGMSI